MDSAAQVQVSATPGQLVALSSVQEAGTVVPNNQTPINPIPSVAAGLDTTISTVTTNANASRSSVTDQVESSLINNPSIPPSNNPPEINPNNQGSPVLINNLPVQNPAASQGDTTMTPPSSVPQSPIAQVTSPAQEVAPVSPVPPVVPAPAIQANTAPATQPTPVSSTPVNLAPIAPIIPVSGTQTPPASAVNSNFNSNETGQISSTQVMETSNNVQPSPINQTPVPVSGIINQAWMPKAPAPSLVDTQGATNPMAPEAILELKLGTLSGNEAASDLREKKNGEKVPGLVMGDNNTVADIMGQSTGDPKPPEEKKKYAPHPLADLYENLEAMAKDAQLIAEQQMAAERQNRTLEQAKDDMLGWQITGKVAHVLMIASWFLSVVSLCFPLIFKNLKSNQGLSVDFILFVVTIMVLLTGTILSFWVRSQPIIKLVTWVIFVIFVTIFLLISLHSGGIIKSGIPVINIFLNRFSF